jgi:hypothetical protein
LSWRRNLEDFTAETAVGGSSNSPLTTPRAVAGHRIPMTISGATKPFKVISGYGTIDRVDKPNWRRDSPNRCDHPNDLDLTSGMVNPHGVLRCGLLKRITT